MKVAEVRKFIQDNIEIYAGHRASLDIKAKHIKGYCWGMLSSCWQDRIPVTTVRGTDDNGGMLCVYNKFIRKIEVFDPPMTPPRIIQGEYIQINIRLQDGDAVLMIDKHHYYAKTANILKKMEYKGEKV